MKKEPLIVLLLLIFSNCFAQKLAADEKVIFDQVAYTRKTPGDYERVSKWAIPIRYQIYGDTAAYIVKEIDSTFASLKKLTNLDIQKTKDSDEANFIIVLGIKEKVEALTSKIDQRTTGISGFSYKRNKANEIYRMEQVYFTEKISDRLTLRSSIKRNLTKSFGFFTETPLIATSLFYSKNNLKVKLDEFDSHIISALYHPEIKSGMTKDEVDKILGQ